MLRGKQEGATTISVRKLHKCVFEIHYDTFAADGRKTGKGEDYKKVKDFLNYILMTFVWREDYRIAARIVGSRHSKGLLVQSKSRF